MGAAGRKQGSGVAGRAARPHSTPGGPLPARARALAPVLVDFRGDEVVLGSTTGGGSEAARVPQAAARGRPWLRWGGMGGGSLPRGARGQPRTELSPAGAPTRACAGLREAMPMAKMIR